MEYVIRRGGTYHYRRRIPADLVAAYGGKKEFQKALGTADYKEARTLRPHVDVEFNNLLAGLRAEMAIPVAETDPVVLNAETWNPYKPIAFSSEAERLRFEAALESMAGSDSEVAAMLADIRSEGRKLDKQRRRKEEMKDAIRAVLEEQRVSLAPSQPVQQPPEPVPATSVAKASSKPVDSLSALVPIWIKSRDPGKAAIATMHATVERFEVSAGKHAPRFYKRPHVNKFRDDLQATGLAPATLRSRVGMLRALFSAAMNNDPPLVDANPCQGVKTDLGNVAKTARLPFERADIVAIMGSPVFSAGARPKGGAGEASYWLPLLAMYTGCRMEELGQLSPKDIKHDHYRDRDDKEQPVSVIYITDDGENQGLKNYASRRRIPVHNDLVKLGFIEYVANQKGARLFPLLRADNQGRETARFSYWFGTYLRGVCKITDKRKTFHSFRHMFIDTMREVGVEEATSQALTGHTSGDISRNYGGAFHPLRPLVEAMAKYKLPGVKLPG
ncbi:site-specific integrase [Caballeronia sordidicola]|uniref:Integrase n=1 Tax=Caballeronia sordidicola TaxID=196367 RepID=A0A226WYM5_CABSO|nr:site-specific integrase [Caballeronia sordidicola]OXC76291.1 Integrase [Caballeronia sordidicola]